MATPNETVIALRLDANVAAGLRTLAQREGREPAEQVTWLVIEALLKAELLEPDLREWLLLRERVVQRFGLKAIEATKAEGWRTDIIAETGRRLMTEDAAWAHDYARLIDADPYARGVKVKDRINPLLGKRVKLLLGAETGNPFSVPQPSIFTTSSHLLARQMAAA